MRWRSSAVSAWTARPSPESGGPAGVGAYRADVNLVLSEPACLRSKLPGAGTGDPLRGRTACFRIRRMSYRCYPHSLRRKRKCDRLPRILPAGEDGPIGKRTCGDRETVYAQSLLQSLKNRRDLNVEAICPLSLRPELLGSRSLSIRSEEEIQAEVADADMWSQTPCTSRSARKSACLSRYPTRHFPGGPSTGTCRIWSPATFFKSIFPGIIVILRRRC